MIRSLALICFIVGSCIPCFSQNTDAIKKQINEIKKKSNIYFYSDVTANTEQDAKNLAEEFLYDEINKWSAHQKSLKESPTLLINNKKKLASSLTTPRGNMFRCFIYVKKSDIKKIANFDIIENKSLKSETDSQIKYVYPEFVREITNLTNYTQLDKRLRKAKQIGEISEYASNNFPTNPQDYYFVIYNQAGQIIAILSTGENRTNIRSGEYDSLQNYKGNKAVGFKL